MSVEKESINRGKFAGKTLLVLGTNNGATDIVEYAKENGAFTIVADYYPPEKSAAKRVADKGILVSTTDIESISKIVEENQVDGILAGIGEINIVNACIVSEKYHLPFHFTMEQWDLIQKKDSFRKLCEKHNVPCPRTFFIGEKLHSDDLKKMVFPVVIKPVDACNSRGVYICETISELVEKEEKAREHSKCGSIIVEEFCEGDEFTAHYTIVNGKATLMCIDNRYPVAVNEGNVTTVPIARIYPCTYIDEYIKYVDSYMVQLCENIGIKSGLLFIQGLYDDKRKCFHVFEAGLRSAGEAPHRFIKKVNGLNAMHILVDHVLGVDTCYNIMKEDPFLKGKCCGIVSFVATGGVVGAIEGLEDAVRKTSSVIEYESRYPVGAKTPNGNTLRQLMIRFVMICDNREQMAYDIQFLNEHIRVLDENRKNMVLKMEPKRVFTSK